MCVYYTGCPTHSRNRHFFNNSNTNEDIATKFEQEYVRCVRNEEECVCSVCLFRCTIFIGVTIIKEMLGSVSSGTFCTINLHICTCIVLVLFLVTGEIVSHSTKAYVVVEV